MKREQRAYAAALSHLRAARAAYQETMKGVGHMNMTESANHENMLSATRAAASAAHRSERLLERAVEALERIAGALAGEPKPDVPDAALAADVKAGLSLRQCAEKHRVGVGRVRGAVARQGGAS